MSIITYRLKLYQKVLPTQNSRSTHTLSSKENEIISIEIIKLLKKTSEFISSIFTRYKKDGNKRMTLNLSTSRTLMYPSIMSLTSLSQMCI